MPHLEVWSEWEPCWATPESKGAGSFLAEAGGVPQDMRAWGTVGCGSSNPRLSPPASLQLLIAQNHQPAGSPGVKLAGWA